ncbi:MAG TPA: DUF3592 domain-containing protein [Spirochaetota bacterium]|nr:DUF3592 domain-containing protein [Spirochaetota bacterium]HPJ37301.1 DUF3592 domain-containing protein [Spirochaetota bacterium]HPQ52952.1 DUF3592 domain-containing protein [Spirochaetota bacterium]
MKKFRRIAAYCIGPLVILLGWYIGETEHAPLENLVRGKGRIISSVIREEAGTQNMKEYIPEISYSYTVGEAQYTSKNITFSPVIFNTKMEAERVTERYRPEAVVQIYYDRTNPSTAYLEAGTVGNGGLTVVLGIIISLILMPLLFLTGRRNRGAGISQGGS